MIGFIGFVIALAFWMLIGLINLIKKILNIEKKDEEWERLRKEADEYFRSGRLANEEKRRQKRKRRRKIEGDQKPVYDEFKAL